MVGGKERCLERQRGTEGDRDTQTETRNRDIQRWSYLEIEADREMEPQRPSVRERERDTNTQQGLREAGRPVSRETAVEAGLTQCTPHTHMHTHAETGLRLWMDSQTAGQTEAGMAGPLVALLLSAHSQLDPTSPLDGLCV